MKQKLILFLLCCICTMGVAAQGIITRQTTQQQTKPKPKPKPKPRSNTPTQTRTQSRPAQGSSSSHGSNKTFTANGVSFTMIYVQGGTFTMGAISEQGSDAYDSEKPAHSVTLSSYYIGETEVTQALWQAVMDNNPSSFTGDNRLPVEEVSWEDCQTFISRLNSLTSQHFRLPTEAQWEYAARGGNRSHGYKYSGSNDVGSVAWYYGNSGNVHFDDSSWNPDKLKSNNCRTHPVKTKQPNELGIYDMSGNVWEWCQDWYSSYSSGAQTNPTGASSGSYRVKRGGDWYYEVEWCRVFERDYFLPSNANALTGFRLAL